MRSSSGGEGGRNERSTIQARGNPRRLSRDRELERRLRPALDRGDDGRRRPRRAPVGAPPRAGTCDGARRPRSPARAVPRESPREQANAFYGSAEAGDVAKLAALVDIF